MFSFRNTSQFNTTLQCLFAASLTFMLVGRSWTQVRGGVDSKVAEPIIMSVLSKANVSGSLEYWGRCGKIMRFWDYPQIRVPEGDAETAVETLRKIFADDPYMQVTQEENGTIRMVETDVPRDLPDLSISHISFDGGARGTTRPDGTLKIEPWVLDDPNDALAFILSADDVRAFMKDRDIGPPYGLNPAHPSWPGSPRISGNLENVTLSQALDHVLKTFPGLWVYENCPSEKRKRVVSFRFYTNSVAWAARVKQQ